MENPYPYRGDGTERPAGVVVPPARMPLFRAGRMLTRWRYVGVYGPEMMLCAGPTRAEPAHSMISGP